MTKVKNTRYILFAVILLSVVQVASAFNQPPVVSDISASTVSIVVCEGVEFSGNAFDPESGTNIVLRWTVYMEGTEIYNGPGAENIDIDIDGGKLNTRLSLGKKYTENPGNLKVVLTGSDGDKIMAKEKIVSIVADDWPIIDSIEVNNFPDRGVAYPGDEFDLKVNFNVRGKYRMFWEYNGKVFSFSGNADPSPHVKVLSAETSYDQQYTIKATIWGPCGKKAEKEIKVSVMDIPLDPPLAKISIPAHAGEEQEFTVESISTTKDGYQPRDAFTCQWRWNKKSDAAVLGASNDCGFTTSIYDGGKLYEFHLKVTNKRGISDETVADIFIDKTRYDTPVADISAMKSTAIVGQDFELNGTRSYSPQGFLGNNWTILYKWTIISPYGDRETINTAKPVILHRFNWTGLSKVELIVSTYTQGAMKESVPVSLTVSVVEQPTPSVVETVFAHPAPVDTISQYSEPEPEHAPTAKATLPPFVLPPSSKSIPAVNAIAVSITITAAYLYTRRSKQ